MHLINNKETLESLDISESKEHGLPPLVFDSIEFSLDDEDLKNELLIKLRGSLSLDKEEKLRVIREMPSLSLLQVQMLIDVFDQETQKFNELIKKEFDQAIYHGKCSFSVQNNIKELFSRAINEWGCIRSYIET